MKFRPLQFAAAAFLAAAVPATAGAGSPGSELDRESARLAASLVLGDLRAELRARPADPGRLRDAMLADPGANSDPAAAKDNMEAVQSAAFAAEFAEAARALLDRLAAPLSREERFGAEFAAGAETAPRDDVAAAVAASFPAAFDSARADAVRMQAAEFDATVRPSPEDVETFPRDSLLRLVSELVEKSQKTAIFAENRDYIRRTIAPKILDEAFAQRDWQRGFVEKTGTTAGSFAPSAVAAELSLALARRIGERRAAEPENFFYAPFPSATGEVARAAAAKRAEGRFLEAAAAAPVPFDENAVRAAMDADPAAHRRRKDSFAAFAPAMRTSVREAAESALLARAPEAERAEFEAFLRSKSEDRAFAGAVAARVESEALPRLAAMRDAMARDEFSGRCGALADGSWRPAEALLDSICGAEDDFRKTLRGWRSQPGLSTWNEAAPADGILEETASAVDAALVAAFEPGAAGRAFQHKTTDGLYDTVKAEVSAMGEKPRVKEVAAAYAARVLSAWTEARPKILGFTDGAGDDGRYRGLFPSVERKIELLAKTMVEQLEEERKKEEERPPDPETPPQPDSPPPELKLIEIDCSLVFDRRGDGFEVSVVADGKEVGRFSCPSEPSAFRGAVAGFSGSAASALADLLREKTREGTVSLTVRMDVRDGLIYWAAVSGVSESVREAVKGFGDAVSAAFAE